MTARATAVVSLLLVLLVTVRADDWLSPTVRTVFSPNGTYFVRVTPGATINTRPAPGTTDPTRAGAGARGEFYARRADRSYALVADVRLQNPVSPAYAIVTNDGYLVTFDDWFTLGFSRAIVFYRPNGQRVREYAVEELYPPDRLQEIPRSVSSRWWRCGVWYTPASGGNGESLTVLEHFGGSFQLDARAATFSYRSGAGTCEPGHAVTFSGN